MDNHTPPASSTSPIGITGLDEFLTLAAAEDLSSLLAKSLDVGLSLFQAHAGSILFQDQSLHQHRAGNPSADILTHIDQTERVVAERLKSGVWRVLESDLLPISSKRFEAEKATVVNTPLLKDTRVIGSYSLVMPGNVSLSIAQRSILSRLAHTIGHLATTVSELTLTQKRYQELDLLFKTGQALVTTFDINKLLDDIMRLAANVLDAAAASIMLIDENTNKLVFAASHSPHAEILRKQRIALGEGIAGWVARHGRPTIANDVTSDPRFSRKVDVRTGFLSRSIAAVPLKLKGHTVGVLEVLNKRSERGFDDDDLRLMTSIAAQATIALENAKLYQSVRRERDKVIKAQEDVRQALSRNLHDGTIQQLSAISMSLEYLGNLIKVDPAKALNEIQAIQILVDKATKDARLVLFELRPIILETQGLIPALTRYVNQLNETEDIIIEADLNPLPERPSRNVAGTIFSIIQEAVNNSRKHAQAKRIKILVQSNQTHMMFQVEDDGRGFDVDRTQSSYAGRSSLGLVNMLERAELIDGVLDIRSRTESDRHGTVVTLSVPIKKTGTDSLKNPLLV